MLSAAQCIQSSLSMRAAASSDTVSVASMVVSVWRDTDAALTPIIGHRGVTAIFGRSLHLTRADHPWLVPAHETTAEQIDFAALQSTLSQQTSADVISFNGALLQQFVELLTHLIGGSLTEQLLRPVVEIHSTAGAAQEPSR